MSVQAIVESVFAAVGSQIETIEKEAERKAHALRRRTEEALAERKAHALHSLEHAIAQEREFARWQAEKGEFNKMNETKRSALRQVVEKSLKELLALPEKAQHDILKKQVDRAALMGAVIVVPSKEHKAALSKLVAQYEKMSLSKETIAAAGGFRVESAAADADATWESLVEESAERALPDLLSILFPKP